MLEKAFQILTTMRMAITDLDCPSNIKRNIAIRNVIVHGRTVTFALQKLLRGKCKPDFDEWYVKKQNQMKSDQLMKYFQEARNELEKEANLKSVNKMTIHYFDMDMMRKLEQNKPPNAVAFFIGDQMGGSGWEVDTGDGIRTKYYIDLPDGIMSYSWCIKGEIEHNGKTYHDLDMADACRMYFAYLNNFVLEAARTFRDI